jgi:glycosyltransferase involved in cell wall biosynthesis
VNRGRGASAAGRLRSALGRSKTVLRIRRRLRHLLRGLRPARSALVRLRPMFGRRPWLSLRFYTIALLVGDHQTALASARRRAAQGDEQALFVHLAALWQAGDEGAAWEGAAEAVALGGDARLRAVVRFYEYVEQLEQAQVALDAMRSPDPALMIDLGLAWRRHGAPERALSLFGRALARDPRSSRASEHRELALSDLRLLHWQWAPDARPGRLKPRASRILHMVERSLPHHFSGSTYRTHYTVLAQRATGLDAHVVTQPGFPWGMGAPWTEWFEIHNGVPYHRLQDGLGPATRVDERLRRNLAKVSALVQELRPALLHPASDYRNAAVAVEVGGRFGIPVVYEVRGFPEEYHRRRPGSRVLYEEFGTRRRIEAECWRRADRIVTLAEVMRRHIESKGVDPERIVVVPNAVDPEVFAPVPRDDALVARLGVESGDTVIGYVGTFSPYEGIQFLVEAVARLTHAGRRVRAVLVGDGPELSQLKQLARRLGVGDRVVFTGRVQHERLPAYYGVFDIFVAPRTAEITSQLVTPLKPYEAMAMERPVVVSATEALLEIVDPGETGLTFEPESAEDLARCVERLIEDLAERARLGAQAREWVCAHRSWRQNVERYRDIYGELGVQA